MKYKWNHKPDVGFPSGEEEPGEIKRYGGYSTRHQYEQKKRGRRRLWLNLLQGSILLALIVLSSFGVLALVQGRFFPEEAPKTHEDASTIKVPTQNELSQVVRDTDEMLGEVALSLVTVEALLEDGSTRYGSGFLLSEDGYALCSTALLSGTGEVKELRGYTVEGITYPITLEGRVDELGFALIRLEGAFGSITMPTGNFSFVERGETLYAVPPSHMREFPGTALAGIASTKTSSIKVTLHNTTTTVPVMVVDMTPNESLWGAPVVDAAGNAIGFCSHAIPSPFGNMVSVVSIHVVYTMVNNILGD